MMLSLLQGLLQGCNSMCAGYLFQQDKQYDVTYDTGDKAIQCGRHVDIFKFWLMWKAKVCVLASLLLSVSWMCLKRAENASLFPLPQGTVGFEQHIDKCLELAVYLYDKIKNRAGFEMVFNGEVGSSEYCYHLMKRCGGVPAFCAALPHLISSLLDWWGHFALLTSLQEKKLPVTVFISTHYKCCSHFLLSAAAH